VRRRSEKYVIEGSKYAHWIGLYISFYLNWVLGPFVHGRLQNLQTCEVIFAHAITPLIIFVAVFRTSKSHSPEHPTEANRIRVGYCMTKLLITGVYTELINIIT